MSSGVPHAAPDYELDDVVVADASAQHRALASDVRSQILDLVLERAATTGELKGFGSALGKVLIEEPSIARALDLDQSPTSVLGSAREPCSTVSAAGAITSCSSVPSA